MKRSGKNSDLLIRSANINELEEIQTLFSETISTVCKNDYSPEQINAWKSSVKNVQRWRDKLVSQYFIIALSNDKIAGYASLENDNHLDFFMSTKITRDRELQISFIHKLKERQKKEAQ